ncbi:MAG: hypothetical protein LBH60_05980 [Prevotellaceae bacterium]|jgi:hypothetical protein|nr:hypothetical protein [Prevotellaceae bacterium]
MNGIAIIRGALSTPKVRDSTEIAVKTSLNFAVVKLFQLAGQAVDGNDLKVIVKEVAADLHKRYRGMTMEEVEYALNAGVRGDYGEYYGINVVSINKWLKAYYSSDERREAIRSTLFPEKALLPEHRLTPDETELARHRAALAKWQQFKQSQRCGGRVDGIYRYLDGRGLIPFTVEEKHSMVATARKELQREAKEEAGTVRSVELALGRITEDAVLNRARLIAVNAFFARLVNEGKELKEMLE